MLVPTIFRTQAVWSGVAGAPYYTNLYFTGDGTGASADDAQLATGSFFTALAPAIKSGILIELNPEVQEFDVVSGNLLAAYGVTGGSIAGSASGDMMARTTQGLIQWRTGNIVSGRFLKGRTFVGAPTEASNDALGVPSSGYRATLQDAAQDLVDNADSVLVVWSRTHGVASPVTVANAWDQWAELRSRRD